jgi:hypothetical protein
LCERCGGEESKQNYVKPPKKTKRELRKQDTIECLKAWDNVKDIVLSRTLKGMDTNATQGETKEETSSAEVLHQIKLDFEFDFYEEKQAQRMVRGTGGSIEHFNGHGCRGSTTGSDASPSSPLSPLLFLPDTEKGVPPDNNSCTIMPKLQQSDVQPCPLPKMTSGAKNSVVPHMVNVIPLSWFNCLAMDGGQCIFPSLKSFFFSCII